MKFFRVIPLVIATAIGAPTAHAATLSDLIAGGTLTQGDVVFDNFSFMDFFDSVAPFAGDRPVAASEIEVTTGSAVGSVSLTFTIDPAISIAGQDAASGFRHIFEFFLDFRASVAAPSTRVFSTVTLGGGDLFATGGGVSEVIYDIDGVGGLNDLEIFEAPGFAPSSQSSDSFLVAGPSSLSLFGLIEGDTGSGDTAGLSTFTLTFDLEGQEPPAIPLPASVLLLVAGLGGLGIAGRRSRRT